MLFLSGLTFCQVTFSTGTIFAFCNKKVCSRKRVSFFTVYAPCIHSADSIPARKVFFLGNCFKVIGVNARTISTKMVYLLSRRNFPFANFISNSVGPFCNPLTVFSFLSKFSITKTLNSDPVPTVFRFTNLAPESLFGRHFGRKCGFFLSILYSSKIIATLKTFSVPIKKFLKVPSFTSFFKRHDCEVLA